jgi:hypothetical protein
MKKIAIEEHFFTQSFMDYMQSIGKRITEGGEKTDKVRVFLSPGESAKLVDIGEGRIKAMDEAGIDMQVLSVSCPGIEAVGMLMRLLVCPNKLITIWQRL